MPLVTNSSYRPPWYLFNGHLQTIVPFLKDKQENDLYETERLELDDGDFLDLAWKRSGSDRLLILSHGLEGNCKSYYVKNAVKYFHKRGWDVLAWNFRGCSSELNRLPRCYHAADTDDLDSVVNHALKSSSYETVVLGGYSMGGLISLNYGSKHIPDKIKAITAFSVPCVLEDCVRELDKYSRRIYTRSFLKKLIKKATEMASIHPNTEALQNLSAIKTMKDFNRLCTVPLHGMKDLAAYHDAANCLKNLEKIAIPTLIVNAKNDPMLGGQCYPIKEAKDLEHVWLEIPDHGGHAGFPVKGSKASWMEKRMEAFFSQLDLEGVN